MPTKADYELAAWVADSIGYPTWDYATNMIANVIVIANARAQWRAEARGAAAAPSGTPAPPDPTTPATADLEHVGAIVWATWWKTHGEHDPSFEFSQIYETARQRWLDIAAAGIDAYLSKKGGPKSAP